MRGALAGMGLIGALAASGCADQATTRAQAQTQTPTQVTGQEASVLICAPGSFRDGNECLPVKTDCPSGTALQDGSCVVTPVAEEPPPPPADPPDAVAMVTPPSFDAVVDARRARMQPRARALLITELQALERLFQATPKAGADRPRLMRRLAEGYVELGAAAARDGQATAMGSELSKMQKIEQAARAAAIKYYKSVLQDYPRFCMGPAAANPVLTTGCADEVLYFLSLEYIRSSQMDQARRSLLQLIQNHPQSSFLGHAYFQFGEMFFVEATQDPSKWAMAEQTYVKAATYSSSSIAPYALLRLAEVYTGMGDKQRAQATYRKVAREHPSSGAVTLIPPGP